MRLTDDILRASDENMAEFIGKAFVLASVGRFGLLPSAAPFEISLNVGEDVLSVESLTCLAVTKNGQIIDVQYDTLYSNSMKLQVAIPNMPNVEDYILTIDALKGQWNGTADGMEEPVYAFTLRPSETTIPENAMPIAHIVNEYGWRIDDVDFVPPCLFVVSHGKFIELQNRFMDVLAMLDTKSQKAIKSGARNMISIFLPLVQQLRIATDKERDLFTPMMLLSNVQKCVSAFTCACSLDDNIELSDSKMFQSFVLAPYNYKEAYQRIKLGLNLCFSIAEKVEKLSESAPIQPAPPVKKEVKCAMPAPVLSNKDLMQICNTSETVIHILYNSASANIFFTIDGSNPTPNSAKAAKTRDGFRIKFDNGFRRENGKEADKSINIKLIAVDGGESSEIASYTIVLKKDLKFRNAIPI